MLAIKYYADQEVKDLAAERRIKRRADFEKKSNTGGPPSKMQKTEENRFVNGGVNVERTLNYRLFIGVKSIFSA